MIPTPIKTAFDAAIELAGTYAGLTSPNPCVGAAALDKHGILLGVAAHERAGEGHAEARLIESLEKEGKLSQARTLLVTLEPCNHFGRTPPCTEAILRAGFRELWFAVPDPNPRVAGHGAERLRGAGLSVCGPNEILDLEPGSDLIERSRGLIRSFEHWVRTGRPWVTLKTAINLEGTMLPPLGQKTFTNPSSLKLAHELRKRADAILTGSGTVLADSPLFTVRQVPDHPGKTRWLVVLDRRQRVPESYYTQAANQGFRIHQARDLAESLEYLGSQGVLEVLVEAGPTLSRSVIEGGFWDQHVLIQQEPGAPDHVEVRFRQG